MREALINYKSVGSTTFRRCCTTGVLPFGVGGVVVLLISSNRSVFDDCRPCVTVRPDPIHVDAIAGLAGSVDGTTDDSVTCPVRRDGLQQVARFTRRPRLARNRTARRQTKTATVCHDTWVPSEPPAAAMASRKIASRSFVVTASV